MLDIVDVYKNITDRQKRRKEVFKCVLKQCEKQVRNVSDTDGMKCLFVVPEFVWGMPLYNVSECTLYVKTELEKSGFKVIFYFPCLLHISWDVADLEHRTTSLLAIEGATPDQQLIDKPKKEVMKGVKSKRRFVLNLA